MRDDEYASADGQRDAPRTRTRLTAATFSGMRWSYVDAVAAGVMQLINGQATAARRVRAAPGARSGVARRPSGTRR